MKLHFFTISSQAPEQGQEALNAFCAQHRVVSLEKQFVTQGLESFWSICVTSVEGAKAEQPYDNANGKRDRIDYKEILSAQDFSVFAELRNLRKSLAEQEGVPAYALFTNEQLAAMVTQRVQTLAALSAIEGVGKARLEKYGVIFLNVLQSALAGRPPVSDASPAH
ncbi:MAG: HRDC domain-containing protein [Candidatus Methylumidiphilus sp.]